MESLALLLVLGLIYAVVRWTDPNRRKRVLPIGFDRNGQVVVTGRDRSWLGLLLAAGIGYVVARRRDRHELIGQAEAIPVVTCRRCHRPVQADPVAGWLDSRGRWQCVGQIPHEPTMDAPERHERHEAERPALPF